MGARLAAGALFCGTERAALDITTRLVKIYHDISLPIISRRTIVKHSGPHGRHGHGHGAGEAGGHGQAGGHGHHGHGAGHGHHQHGPQEGARSEATGDSTWMSGTTDSTTRETQRAAGTTPGVCVGPEACPGRGSMHVRGPMSEAAPRSVARGGIRFAILGMLKEKPRHGYDIIREMEDSSGGLYSPSPGAIYPTLQALEDQDLVTSVTEEGKKVYSISRGWHRLPRAAQRPGRIAPREVGSSLGQSEAGRCGRDARRDPRGSSRGQEGCA